VYRYSYWPCGSSAGPSGWRYEYAKAASEYDEGRQAIAVIVTRIASGEFGRRPSTHSNAHIISAARLIALNRGDDKVRPIAVGECLRRLACTCLIRARRSAIEQRCLRASNLMFSSDGSAAAKRTVELLLETNPSWIVVETDLSSAFQRAAREDILYELFDNSELRAFRACSSSCGRRTSAGAR
jgi:hypothetical protein